MRESWWLKVWVARFKVDNSSLPHRERYMAPAAHHTALGSTHSEACPVANRGQCVSEALIALHYIRIIRCTLYYNTHDILILQYQNTQNKQPSSTSHMYAVSDDRGGQSSDCAMAAWLRNGALPRPTRIAARTGSGAATCMREWTGVTRRDLISPRRHVDRWSVGILHLHVEVLTLRLCISFILTIMSLAYPFWL